MISLQRSMHSSQMYTPGPAMSFLTCFCDLPQKEHFRRSESPNFATAPRSFGSLGPADHPRTSPEDRLILRCLRRGGCEFSLNFARGDDLVDDAVLPGLLGIEDVVPVRVLGHLFQLLPGVLGDDLLEQLPVPGDLLRLDLDVHGLALRATVGLVQQDPGVRE